MKKTRMTKLIKKTLWTLSLVTVGILAAPSQASVLTDYITAIDQNATNRFAGNLIVGTTNTVFSPVAHWLMNDNAANKTVVDVVNGHNGSTVSYNTSAMHVTGKINGALNLQAMDYITFNDTGMPSGSSPFTISAWFKTSSAQSWNQIFFIGTAPAPGQAYWMVLSGGILSFDAYGYAGIEESGTSNDGNWHHACMTYDGSVVCLYKDSSLVAINTQDLSVSLTGTGYIGSDSYSGNKFDGALDDIRVYASALNPAGVAAIFNSGAGTESNQIVTAASSGTAQFDSAGNLTLSGSAVINGYLTTNGNGGQLTNINITQVAGAVSTGSLSQVFLNAGPYGDLIMGRFTNSVP